MVTLLVVTIGTPELAGNARIVWKRAHTVAGLKSGDLLVRGADLEHVTYFVYITLVFRPYSKPAFCSLSFRSEPVYNRTINSITKL